MHGRMSQHINAPMGKDEHNWLVDVHGHISEERARGPQSQCFARVHGVSAHRMEEVIGLSKPMAFSYSRMQDEFGNKAIAL